MEESSVESNQESLDSEVENCPLFRKWAIQSMGDSLIAWCPFLLDLNIQAK